MPSQASEPPIRTHRAMSMVFPEYLAQHVDRQAERQTCSRAAYIRRLVLEDFERKQAQAVAA